MALTSIEDYRTLRKNKREIYVPFTKNSRTVVANRPYSYWLTAPNAGTAPTTAVAPDNTTTGTLWPYNFGTFTAGLYIAELCIVNHVAANNSFELIDRLSHQGGLGGNVATVQTTNLPTAALTRYTDGEGVQVAAEIYTNIGTTGSTTFQLTKYTNTTPTANQASKFPIMGGTGLAEAGTFIKIPLADGDTGLRSVEEVQLGVGTGATGAWGVTLYKSLGFFAPTSIFMQHGGGKRNKWDNVYHGVALVEIQDNACLSLLGQSSTTATQIVQGHLKLIEV